MPLLAIQAFVNTLDLEEGTDELESVESFKKFLIHTDQIVPGFQVKEHHLPLARELRGAVRDALAVNGNGGADPKITGRMSGAARTLAIDLLPDRDGNLMLDLAPVESFATLGSQMLAIAFQAQIEGTWERLKLCENPDCQWAFYDNSRNRSGSWCRM